MRAEDDRIILEPLKADRAAQVREKLARLKLSEADVAKAPGHRARIELV